MADYIYTMETRLTPDQLKAVTLVQDIARAHGMNLYLTGGAIRDILTGFPIRDLDFTVQGNALKFQKDLEKAGAKVDSVDEHFHSLHFLLPGNVRAELSMARAETYEKPGKPPLIAPATINEDLRRRDFTINAMALSLNEGSRGLLADPFNGSADIENKVVRILHNYAFFEEPSRLIRATRFCSRFHWELEERTKARFEAAKEGNYIEYINRAGIGYEIEQVAHEEDPLNIVRALEKEGWLKVLHPHWSTAKIDTAELQALIKTRQQMSDIGMTVDAAPAVMYMMTSKLGDKDTLEIQRLIPHREFVAAWKRLEDDAKDLAKQLQSKEANQPSGAWKILTEAKPEALLFLDVTVRNKSVDEKIKNFFGKWRQMKEKLPFIEMAELLITPQIPDYAKLVHELHMQLIDGKLRNHTEIMKFLKPFAPPPPPPPPPPSAKRGKGAKGEAAAKAKKGKGAVPTPPLPAKTEAEAVAKPEKAEKKPAAKAVAAPEHKAETKHAAKVPAKHHEVKHEAKKLAKKPAAKAPAKKAAPKPAPKKPVAKKPAPKKPEKPVSKPAKKKKK